MKWYFTALVMTTLILPVSTLAGEILKNSRFVAIAPLLCANALQQGSEYAKPIQNMNPDFGYIGWPESVPIHKAFHSDNIAFSGTLPPDLDSGESAVESTVVELGVIQPPTYASQEEIQDTVFEFSSTKSGENDISLSAQSLGKNRCIITTFFGNDKEFVWLRLVSAKSLRKALSHQKGGLVRKMLTTSLKESYVWLLADNHSIPKLLK